MPNLLAHYLLANQFYVREGEISSKIKNKSFIENNKDLFFLGAYGPDPLFYSGVNPFRGLHLINAAKKYGNKIHKSDGRLYFKSLIDVLHSIESETEANQFKSFIFGQFAHYLLDREAHPYILYKSGFSKDGKIKGIYHYKHAYYESKIDSALATSYNFDRFFSKPEEIIPHMHSYLKFLDKYYYYSLRNYFNDKRINKHYYSNGVINFYSWIKYSNHGSPLRVKIFGKTSLSATRVPRQVREDVLNENKNVWLYPTTGDKSNKSFHEILVYCSSLLEKLYVELLKKGFTYETFSKYIDGRNYYGNFINAKWIYKEEKNK